MWNFGPNASGTIIIMAWGSERPAITRSSSALSKIAESLPSSMITGLIFARSAPNSSDSIMDSRARIRLMFPRKVLISPLCARNRYGWARCHVGRVFVLYLWCTTAKALAKDGARRAGGWGAGEHPLVDDGAGREAVEVELARVAVGPAPGLFLRPPADDIELPFEG